MKSKDITLKLDSKKLLVQGVSVYVVMVYEKTEKYDLYTNMSSPDLN